MRRAYLPNPNLAFAVAGVLSLALIVPRLAVANDIHGGTGLGLMTEPRRVDVAPNQVVNLAVIVDRYNNPAPVTLTVGDQPPPPGLQVTFQPAQMQVTEAEKSLYEVRQNAFCQIALSESISPGTYLVTIKAEDGTTSVQNTVILNVAAGR